MKTIVYSFLMFSVCPLLAKAADTRQQVTAMTDCWTNKDLNGMLNAINQWEALDAADPSLWLVKIYYYFYLKPDRQLSLNACEELKILGTRYNSAELVAMSGERRQAILSIPAEKFIPHSHAEMEQFFGAFPGGPPFLSQALAARRFRPAN